MPEHKYAAYAGAAPYFELVREALGDLVDGEHFFDIIQIIILVGCSNMPNSLTVPYQLLDVDGISCTDN